MQTFLYCALHEYVHTNQILLLHSQLYIFLMHVSINIPSTIDNIVIKSYRRKMHNKNCDFLNSSIIFLLPPYFSLHYIMNMTVTAVYSSSQQVCR